MGTYVKWILIIIILLFFITFGVKNSESVFLNYHFGIENLELPLYGLAFIAILLGIFAGIIIGITERLVLKRKVRDLTQDNRRLQEEVSRLKASEESRATEEDSITAQD